MKTLAGIIAGLCLLLTCGHLLAATHYVDIDNVTPSDPYTSWGTAATNIQDAIDAASSNDTVLVEDGTYVENIYVNKNVHISSVNGPEVTLVDGDYVAYAGVFSGYGNEYLVSGFTVINGYSEIGGGMYGGTASNCIFSGNYGGQSGGGMAYGTAYNCTFSGNYCMFDGGGMYGGTAYNCIFVSNESSDWGGGMHGGTAYNCTFDSNEAYRGGGMHSGTANDCTFIGNSAIGWSYNFTASSGKGGGMSGGTASNCTFNSNEANSGGGMHEGKAYNCIFTNNTAEALVYNAGWYDAALGGDGGGMHEGNAYSCVFTDNKAKGAIVGPFPGEVYGGLGGGMFGGEAYNCTIVGNWAIRDFPTLEHGGGTYDVSARNCIIYYNSPDNWELGERLAFPYYCCTTPATSGSIGEPLFIDKDAGNYRLAPNSPCINAGSNGYVTVSTDLDGKPRIIDGTVDMGAYEYGIDGCIITKCDSMPSGFKIEWIPVVGYDTQVQCSTNLAETPFTDLSATMAYPLNIYTDTVYGAESECFYRVEMVP